MDTAITRVVKAGDGNTIIEDGAVKTSWGVRDVAKALRGELWMPTGAPRPRVAKPSSVPSVSWCASVPIANPSSTTITSRAAMVVIFHATRIWPRMLACKCCFCFNGR
jgi:hypothetical protein